MIFRNTLCHLVHCISGCGWPDEVWTQAWINRAAVARFCNTGSWIVKRVVRSWQAFFVVAHQIRYYDANAILLVVKHDWGAAGFADAQFQRTIWILVIERHALEAACARYVQIAVFEKHHVSGWLSGNTFAN